MTEPIKSGPLLNIVMVTPEIPQNTGNIGRTCVAMNCHLHLVGPLGFEINDKQLRRSGLDYWPDLKMTQYDNYEAFEKTHPPTERFFYFTTKAKKSFYDIDFQDGDWLVFGPETRGLSAAILEKFQSQTVTIPMIGTTRSLNVSNAVAVAVYEAFRQIKT